MAREPEPSIKFADSEALDRFQRQRMCEPHTILDVKHLHDKQPLLFDEEIVVGAGAPTSVHSAADSAVIMTVTGAGDAIVRQTLMRLNYESGKSQLFDETYVLGPLVANTIKRIGYFSSNFVTPFDSNKDGIWFEDTGSDYALVISKDGVPDRILRASWDDPLDGSGPSGVTIDLTKNQIGTGSFQWLGTGSVQLTFSFDGVNYPAHRFNHAGVDTSVYMKSPNQPLRYEIRSTGGTASLMQICGSVITEGGLGDTGIPGSVDRGFLNNGLAVVNNSMRPLVAFRPQAAYLDITYLLKSISIMASTGANFRAVLAVDPPLEVSGVPTTWDSLTWVPEPNRGYECHVPVTTYELTGDGFRLGSAYSSNNADELNLDVDASWRPGCKIDGTRQAVVLASENYSNETMFGAINFRELL